MLAGKDWPVVIKEMAEMVDMVEGERAAVAREVLGDKVVEMGMEAEVKGR